MPVPSRSAMLALVSVSAVVASACSQEKWAEMKANSEVYHAQKRAPIIAEMKEVMAFVKQEHLAECKARIEGREGLGGGRIKLTAPLQPSVKSTCQRILRDMPLLVRTNTARKYAAFLAPYDAPSSPFYNGPRSLGCVMVLEAGKLTVEPDADAHAYRNSPCHGY